MEKVVAKVQQHENVLMKVKKDSTKSNFIDEILTESSNETSPKKKRSSAKRKNRSLSMGSEKMYEVKRIDALEKNPIDDSSNLCKRTIFIEEVKGLEKKPDERNLDEIGVRSSEEAKRRNSTPCGQRTLFDPTLFDQTIFYRFKNDNLNPKWDSLAETMIQKNNKHAMMDFEKSEETKVNIDGIKNDSNSWLSFNVSRDERVATGRNEDNEMFSESSRLKNCSRTYEHISKKKSKTENGIDAAQPMLATWPKNLNTKTMILAGNVLNQIKTALKTAATIDTTTDREIIRKDYSKCDAKSNPSENANKTATISVFEEDENETVSIDATDEVIPKITVVRGLKFCSETIVKIISELSTNLFCDAPPLLNTTTPTVVESSPLPRAMFCEDVRVIETPALIVLEPLMITNCTQILDEDPPAKTESFSSRGRKIIPKERNKDFTSLVSKTNRKGIGSGAFSGDDKNREPKRKKAEPLTELRLSEIVKLSREGRGKRTKDSGNKQRAVVTAGESLCTDEAPANVAITMRRRKRRCEEGSMIRSKGSLNRSKSTLCRSKNKMEDTGGIKDLYDFEDEDENDPIPEYTHKRLILKPSPDKTINPAAFNSLKKKIPVRIQEPESLEPAAKKVKRSLTGKKVGQRGANKELKQGKVNKKQETANKQDVVVETVVSPMEADNTVCTEQDVQQISASSDVTSQVSAEYRHLPLKLEMKELRHAAAVALSGGGQLDAPVESVASIYSIKSEAALEQSTDEHTNEEFNLPTNPNESAIENTESKIISEMPTLMIVSEASSVKTITDREADLSSVNSEDTQDAFDIPSGTSHIATAALGLEPLPLLEPCLDAMPAIVDHAPAIAFVLEAAALAPATNSTTTVRDELPVRGSKVLIDKSTIESNLDKVIDDVARGIFVRGDEFDYYTTSRRLSSKPFSRSSESSRESPHIAAHDGPSSQTWSSSAILSPSVLLSMPNQCGDIGDDASCNDGRTGKPLTSEVIQFF